MVSFKIISRYIPSFPTYRTSKMVDPCSPSPSPGCRGRPTKTPARCRSCSLRSGRRVVSGPATSDRVFFFFSPCGETPSPFEQVDPVFSTRSETAIAFSCWCSVGNVPGFGNARRDLGPKRSHVGWLGSFPHSLLRTSKFCLGGKFGHEPLCKGEMGVPEFFRCHRLGSLVGSPLKLDKSNQVPPLGALFYPFFG